MPRRPHDLLTGRQLKAIANIALPGLNQALHADHREGTEKTMKIHTVLWALIVVVVLSLVSCASVGRQFDTTHVSDIQNGVQTKQEIRAWFGQPNQTQKVSNPSTGAVERWLYTYAHSTAGISTTSHSLVVDFDESGKVCDNAYSKTN